MHIKYQLTNNIVNNIAEFFVQYGKLKIGKQFIEPTLLQKIIEENNKTSTFAATVMDSPTNIYQLEKIGIAEAKDILVDSEQLKNYSAYLKTLTSLHKLLESYEKIDTQAIINIAKSLNPNPDGWKIRTKERILTFQEMQGGTISKIQKPVKTTPSEIKNLIEDYTKWIRAYSHATNPLILSAITHIKIAQIHPFEDGNGRLSRMLARGILVLAGIDNELLLDLNSYYYSNKSKYFELIESSIGKDDLTEWIEFFLQGAIDSIHKSMSKIYKYSGGSIDLINNKIQVLTPREQKIVYIISSQGNSSGTEIAKILKVSRQNVHVVLNKLEKIGIIKKYGQNTGIRYSI